MLPGAERDPALGADPFGANYLGLGFLAASAISALIAYLALARTPYRLDY